MRALRELVRHLEICDGNMQEGSFRCDANISVKQKEHNKLGTKVEIKNLNSFKFVENAINFEIARQINRLENGGKLRKRQDSTTKKQVKLRQCEAKKMRMIIDIFFSDPDLLPVKIDSSKLKVIKIQLHRVTIK